MREEYDIQNLNPRKNAYAKKLKKQVTINIDNDTIEYFKHESEVSGIPYQILINLYLSDCATNKKITNNMAIIMVKKTIIGGLSIYDKPPIRLLSL